MSLPDHDLADDDDLQPGMLRVQLFDGWPEAVLILLPTGYVGPVSLPVLDAPFAQPAVAQACGDAGLRATVRVGPPGRWTASLARMASDMKAARRQQEVERIAAMVAGVVPPALSNDRADARTALIKEKIDVDAELGTVRTKLAQARARVATQHKYMPASEYDRLIAAESKLKLRSQAIQAQLGDLRRAAHARRNTAQTADFVAVAKRRLDPALFASLLDEAKGQ